jgi:hypothetical protein
MYLRRVQVFGLSYAAALAHLSTAVTPPAPAAENLGVGLRRPCRWKALGVIPGAMARISPVRPAAPCSATAFSQIYA